MTTVSSGIFVNQASDTGAAEALFVVTDDRLRAVRLHDMRDCMRRRRVDVRWRVPRFPAAQIDDELRPLVDVRRLIAAINARPGHAPRTWRHDDD